MGLIIRGFIHPVRWPVFLFGHSHHLNRIRESKILQLPGGRTSLSSTFTSTCCWKTKDQKGYGWGSCPHGPGAGSAPPAQVSASLPGPVQLTLPRMPCTHMRALSFQEACAGQKSWCFCLEVRTSGWKFSLKRSHREEAGWGPKVHIPHLCWDHSGSPKTCKQLSPARTHTHTHTPYPLPSWSLRGIWLSVFVRTP